MYQDLHYLLSSLALFLMIFLPAYGQKPELVLQTETTVDQIVVSPDGRLIAAVRDGRIKLWDGSTGKLLRSFKDDGVISITFSADGHFLASGSYLGVYSPVDLRAGHVAANGRFKIWDINTGQVIGQISGGFGWPHKVRFSHDGKWLAACSRYSGKTESGIKIWEVGTGREIRAIAGPFDDVTFGPGGREMAGLTDRRIRVWETQSWRELHNYNLAEEAAKLEVGSSPEADANTVNTIGLTYASDGRLLAYLGLRGPKKGDHALQLWDSGTKRKLLHLTGYYYPVAISPDGRLLARQEQGRRFSVVDISSGAELWTLADNSEMSQLAFSADSRVIAATDRYAIRLWDSGPGRELQSISLSGRNRPGPVAFPAGGRTFISGKNLWDLSTGAGPRNLPSSVKATLGTWRFSPDARLLAVGTNAVKVYEVETGRELHTLGQADDTVRVLPVFSPNGQVIASVYTVSDEQEERNRAKLADMKPPLEADVARNRNWEQEQCRMRESSENSRKIVLWDSRSGHQMHTLALPDSGLGAELAFSIDGRMLALGPTRCGREFLTDGRKLMVKRTIRIWDIATGRENQTITAVSDLQKEGAWIEPGSGLRASRIDDECSIALSSNGRMLALRCFELDSPGSSEIRLFDVTTSEHRLSLRSDAQGAGVLAFSPDDKYLASAGSFNPVIRIWDAATGKLLKELSGYEGVVRSLAFSTDGVLLALSSYDGTTRLWNTRTGELLATLMSFGDGTEWLVVTPDGLFDGSSAAWNTILWRFSASLYDVAPPEAFFNEFYHPGLLADIFAGKRLRAVKDISQKDRRQPQLKLTLVEGASVEKPITSRNVKVSVSVSEASADKAHKMGSGARDIRLFRNGSLVKVWRGNAFSLTEKDGCKQASAGRIICEVTVSLVSGENQFTAYAFNHDNIKSPDATLTVTGAESLKRAGTAYIVAIGINEYSNRQYNLRYAVADARAFADELQRQQTNLKQFSNIEIINLLDKEATKTNILATLSKLTARVQPEDAVIVYFAGHGTAQQNRFYLLPYDLGYEGPRQRIDKDGLNIILSHSISDRDLEQAFETIDAGDLVLVLDTCNSGQALEAEEKRRGPMNSKGLAQLAYEKGMHILTASQSYQAAREAARLGHGYLTFALVEEGLKTSAADTAPKDTQVTLREWLDYATRRVPRMQREALHQTRDLEHPLAFVEGEEKIKDPSKRSLQQPRVFYRREPEVQPLIIGRP